MRAFLFRLAELPTICAAVALFVMMAMTFCDVVLRSVANAPIEAATELTRIMMAIVVFAVMPAISARGGHISVDLLDRFFTRRAARWRDGAISLLCGAMMWWPVERVAVLAERARSYGDVTEYLGIPQHLIAWGVAIFAGLTMIALIARGVGILVWGDAARLEAGAEGA